MKSEHHLYRDHIGIPVAAIDSDLYRSIWEETVNKFPNVSGNTLRRLAFEIFVEVR